MIGEMIVTRETTEGIRTGESEAIRESARITVVVVEVAAVSSSGGITKRKTTATTSGAGAM